MILGIMAYPDLSPIDRIEEYMALASQYGFTRVTSSMLSVDGDKEEILNYFRTFNALAHKYGMNVALDVNTQLMSKLDQSYDDISLFHEIGCDIIRLDGGYGAENDLKLLKNPYGIGIQLNASSSRVEEELEYFLAHSTEKERTRLSLCHNAYPQRYTGLKWNDFIEKNQRLKKYGLRNMAIVSSNAPNTHGIWGAEDGLPTVERLRDLPIDLQVRMILATEDVDDILIGNAYASREEFEAIASMTKPARSIEDTPIYEQIRAYGPIMPIFGTCKRLKVILEEDITDIERENLLELVPQMDNGDSSEWIWRSRCGRLINKDRFIPPRHYDGEYFPIGSVLIVNDYNRHYSGELQIARKPILNDGKRNLVARLAKDEDQMLALIHDNDLVEFYEYKEY